MTRPRGTARLPAPVSPFLRLTSRAASFQILDRPPRAPACLALTSCRPQPPSVRRRSASASVSLAPPQPTCCRPACPRPHPARPSAHHAEGPPTGHPRVAAGANTRSGGQGAGATRYVLVPRTAGLRWPEQVYSSWCRRQDGRRLREPAGSGAATASAEVPASQSRMRSRWRMQAGQVCRAIRCLLVGGHGGGRGIG